MSGCPDFDAGESGLKAAASVVTVGLGVAVVEATGVASGAGAAAMLLVLPSAGQVRVPEFACRSARSSLHRFTDMTLEIKPMPARTGTRAFMNHPCFPKEVMLKNVEFDGQTLR
jgi:hypothetical protein